MQSIKTRVLEHFEHIKNCSYDEILKADLNSGTFERVMLENSAGLYNVNEIQNKELSSRIEKDYNILNTAILDSLIKDQIDLSNFNSDKFVFEVLEILEIEKQRIDEQQKNIG